MKLICLWILVFVNVVLGIGPLYQKKSVFDDQPGPELPHNLNVDLYEIEIQPFFQAEGVDFSAEKENTFDGKTRIFLTISSGENPEPSFESLTFDAKELKINNFAVYHKSEKVEANISFNEKEKRLTIEPVHIRFEENQKYRIDFEYSGRIRKPAENGFFYSNYKNLDGSTGRVYATQFESVLASTVFPNIDDPHFKANFSLTLISPASMVALSNTNEKSTVSLQNGWKKTSFKTTPRMSSYLLAFAIGDFVSADVPKSENQPLMRVWTWKGSENLLEKAVTAASNCYSGMIELTGVSQPLEKLDHILLPEYTVGGMENWGLIVYLAMRSFYDPLQPSLDQELSINSLFCHEIAHQWFGDLVTTDWWGNLVMNEGFATFFESKSAIGGFLTQSEQFLDAHHVSNTYRAYSANHSHPVISDATHFDAIVYDEGSLIWRMMDQLLPNGAFRRALTRYLNKHAYSTAIYDDLAAEINEEIADSDFKDWCGQNFSAKKFLDYWLTQINYPILNVDIGFASDMKSVVYLLSQSEGGQNTNGRSWPIPLNPLGNDPNYSWLAPEGACEDTSISESLQLPFESDVVFNQNASFFGKVNYSDAAFDMLLKMWSTDMPCEINFLKLLEDEISFKRRHRAFDLAALIVKNAKIKCSNSMVFTNAVKFLMRADFEEAEYLKDYVRELITPVYRKFANWEQPTNGSLNWDARNLQTVLLPASVYLDIADAREKAFAYYEMLKNDSHCTKNPDFITCNPIPFDYRVAAYCAAVIKDGKTATESLSQIADKLNVNYHFFERENIFKTLRCDRYPPFSQW